MSAGFLYPSIATGPDGSRFDWNSNLLDGTYLPHSPTAPDVHERSHNESEVACDAAPSASHKNISNPCSLTSTSFPAPIAVTSPSALRDDEKFLRGVAFQENRSSSSDAPDLRSLFIWRVVLHGCDGNYRLSVYTWLRLLEGGEGNDIWLWVEGDENNMMQLYPNFYRRPDFRLPSNFDWNQAASALSRRRERADIGPDGIQEDSVRKHSARQKVEKSHPHVRFIAIAWRILTSKAMVNADSSRGLINREKWDLKELLSVWDQATLLSEDSPIPMPIIAPESIFRSFARSMTEAGHTCHETFESFHCLRKWIYIRSLLAPIDVCNEAVYLTKGWEATKSCCEACIARNRFVRPASSSDVREPPEYLVVLWSLWWHLKWRSSDRTSGHMIEKWFKWLKSTTLRPSAHVLTTFTSVCRVFWSKVVRSEERDHKYAHWINKYPNSWQDACTSLCGDDWVQAECIIESIQFSHADSRSSREVDARALLGALVLSMESENLEPRRAVYTFDRRVNCRGMQIFLQAVPLPEINRTPAVDAFRKAVRGAHHGLGCYTSILPQILDWYAASSLLLHDTQYVVYVPPGGQHCTSCQTVEDFRKFVTEKMDDLMEDQRPQGMINLLLEELGTIAVEQIELRRLREMSLEMPSSPAESTESQGLSDEQDPLTVVTDFKREIAAPSSDTMVEASITDESSGLSSRDSSPAHYASRRSEQKFLEHRPKEFLVKEIEAYFVGLLEGIGILVTGHYQNKQLPWTTLSRILFDHGWELEHWPHGVPFPGSGGQSCDDNKGINGLDTKQLSLLYDATKKDRDAVGFRRVLRDIVHSHAENMHSQDVIMDSCEGSVNQGISSKSLDVARKRHCEEGEPDEPEKEGNKRPRIVNMATTG